MPVITVWCIATPSNPGGWANPGNVPGPQDGAVATVSPARNAKAYIDLELDEATLSAIPADATLVGTPSRSVWLGADSNAQSPKAFRQWVVDGTPIGVEESVSCTAGVTEEVAAADLTIEQLRASSLIFRLAVQRTGSQSRTFSLDAMSLTIEYTEPLRSEVWNGSAWVGGEAWNGAAWVTPEVWDGTQWVPMKAP